MNKKFLLIFAIILLSLNSCDKTRIWPDYDNPQISIPLYGVSVNTIWDLESGSDLRDISVYCSGLRPDNQKKEITVNFTLDNSMITTYNADITQQYSGQVVELPASCYTLGGNSVTIKQGQVEAKIPVAFNLAAIKQNCTDASKIYVIPIKLTSTSLYSLNSDENFTFAMYGISLQKPVFFFDYNRNGVQIAATKVLADGENKEDLYEIMAKGVPAGEYNLSVSYDPEALQKAYPSYTILPQDAFTITSDRIVYKSDNDRAILSVKYNPEKLEFSKTYYLPLTISSASAYSAHDEYKTLFVRVELKNSYEKPYNSNMFMESESTGRTNYYSVDKDLVSKSTDVVEMALATNTTIAGAGVTGTSTTYDNKFFRLRIVPTSDKSRYNVEYIVVTDKAKANNSPASLEANPEKDSYYDWNNEKFVLNYRWKHTDGEWINVEEILMPK